LAEAVACPKQEDPVLACSSWDVAHALTITPWDSAYCALSGVTGQFEGYEEYAEIVPHGPLALAPVTQAPMATKWYLRVGENRVFHTVRGHAACFVAPDSGLSSNDVDSVAACSQLMQEGHEECCEG
jgi:hypothetical protein